mmetsp:Transcript_51233/g.52197  ORF Transcript_51233/g.52197 Transcript_51233/m.52197 type:complete len:81 (-) Transcript_51233:259-501(-)
MVRSFRVMRFFLNNSQYAVVPPVTPTNEQQHRATNNTTTNETRTDCVQELKFVYHSLLTTSSERATIEFIILVQSIKVIW